MILLSLMGLVTRKELKKDVNRIFQKGGLGPPNGDRYAPFVEEERTDDTTLMVAGGEAEDDIANGDDTCAEGNDIA
ncbi:NAC domain-containing protein 78 [Artemisia annua]|uniref:NAC domain-containing protein 78 n=1 Tax=Artemisia annua TaxID=35608 RepID=A0A2U1P9W9_ARTAN|nr:NAC domain-containing protein 78 [Artemisia annua]